MANDSNFQMGRGAAKHWFYIVAVGCLAVVVWLGSHNWLLGLGSFSTFFSILLFAGQMLAKRTAEEGSFKNWSRTDQVIFAFSLASTAVTGVAYSLALPAMFAC